MVLAIEKSFSYNHDRSFLVACLLDSDGNFENEFGIEPEFEGGSSNEDEDSEDVNLSAVARVRIKSSTKAGNDPQLELSVID